MNTRKHIMNLLETYEGKEFVNERSSEMMV